MKIAVPDELFSTASNLEDFVQEMIQMGDFEHQTIITPLNQDAEEINRMILDQLLTDQEIQTTESIDELPSDNNEFGLTPEFVNELQPAGMPPHKLELKIGCIVMVLRNIYPARGFCNGTRCKVIDIQPGWLVLEIISGQFKGEQTAIPKIKLNSSVSRKSLFTFSRRQFPGKLAYCLTINKSQGQSYDGLGIYLREQVFVHGMLYVALSRCRNHKKIRIFSPSSRRLKNVVLSAIFD